MMILDTNVVSEFTRTNLDPRVSAWLAGLDPARTFTTAVTVAESLAGLATIPVGRRREHLTRTVRLLFTQAFAGRVLPFDEAAANDYAAICDLRRRAGLSYGTFNTLIAAIALSRGMAVATRDRGGFESTGVAVIDPWAAP